MSAKKTTTKASRQGQRAPGKTQTSISLRLDLLQWAQAKAAEDGRSFSNWVEQMIRNEQDNPAPAARNGSTKK